MGTTSFSTTPTAVSFPLFTMLSVYSRTSPGITEPPFRSTTVLPDELKSGLNVEIDVTNAPR